MILLFARVTGASSLEFLSSICYLTLLLFIATGERARTIICGQDGGGNSDTDDE
jgi:hypothetical protein